MQHKPGRLGRILAALFLAIAGPACAQILGDDYEVKEGPGGGGECSELDCFECSSCALDAACAGPHAACQNSGCGAFECCVSCGDPDCDANCECLGWQSRLMALDTCIAFACPVCGGDVSVGVGGG